VESQSRDALMAAGHERQGVRVDVGRCPPTGSSDLTASAVVLCPSAGKRWQRGSSWRVDATVLLSHRPYSSRPSLDTVPRQVGWACWNMPKRSAISRHDGRSATIGIVFSILPPAPSLRSLVQGYWFVRDLAGAYRAGPIRTAARAAAVLTINIGRPNADSFGAMVPKASLLGIQTHARSWISGPDTYFVMVILTVRGLVGLFPGTGAETIDRVLDLGSLIGDRQGRGIVEDVVAAWHPRLITGELDNWLSRRLQSTKAPAEAVPFAAACDMLKRDRRVSTVAAEIGISRRQLQRWSQAHIGLGPKELADLERLQASVNSVQTGRGDPIAGFSDQAHQIRTWRRRLGVTPGTYKPTPLSIMAAEIGGAVSSNAACHHYL
jgi:AraC-like DNA-binding protein